MDGCGGGYEYLHNPPRTEEDEDCCGDVMFWFFLIFWVLPVVAQFLE